MSRMVLQTRARSACIDEKIELAVRRPRVIGDRYRLFVDDRIRDVDACPNVNSAFLNRFVEDVEQTSTMYGKSVQPFSQSVVIYV